MKRTLLPLTLVLTCQLAGLLAPPPAAAQVGVAESQQHLRDAAAARERGDEDGVIRSLETARQLNPASLYTRYTLARAYARNGSAGRALELLEGLARARVDFGIADDPTFAVLADEPRFRRLLATLERSTAPVGNGRAHSEIARIDLLPEGIARDADSGRLFFGSMRSGEIFVIDAGGRLSKFAEVAHDGRLAAIGMTVDAPRGLLWVVGTAFFLTEGYDPQKPAWSGLFGFDLASGEIRHRFLREDVGHGYNDVALAADGALYLSGAELGRLSPGAGAAIETVATSQPIVGSNGIAITPDGDRLITSAYPSGIAVVRLADGETHFLRAPADVTLYGIDGLYLHHGDLVAVQNGIRPWRLVRFTLDEDMTAVSAARILELGHPAVATTAAIAGDDVHYIAVLPAAEPPGHVDAALHEYLGRTVIRTVPLD